MFFRLQVVLIGFVSIFCLTSSPVFAKECKGLPIKSGEVHYKIEGSSDFGFMKTSTLDEGIREIEKVLSCIKRAKTIMDVMNCQ